MPRVYYRRHRTSNHIPTPTAKAHFVQGLQLPSHSRISVFPDARRIGLQLYARGNGQSGHRFN